MIPRNGVRSALVHAIVAAAGVGCTPIPASTDSSPPANTCPAFSCADYASGSTAACQGGACVVDASSTDTLIVLVAVPSDSSYAPDRTIAVALQDLLTPAPSDTLGCSAPDCCLPDCAPLPGIEVVSRAYVIAPSLESATNGGVDWYLGNPGEDTALPIQASYRPLWNGPTGQYATSRGLPLDPIQAVSFPSPGPTYPGPGGGPSIIVQTYLQTDMSYQLTDQPDPPFSAAYPPEVFPFTPTGSGDVSIPPVPLLQFDLTSGTVAAESGDAGLEIPTETLPTFDLSRAAGFDGWTAYLRDATNLNTLSNVVALAGTESPHVVLATNRFGGSGTDALMGVQLVVAPPVGVVAPTEVLTPAGGELPSTETYPPMPDPVSVTAAVTAGAAGAAADLTFEATSVLVGGLETISNFTYTTQASTTTNPATGRAIFSAQLPPGQYRVVARPASGAPASSAVTLAALDVPEFGPDIAPAIALASTQPVSGTLLAADERPLSQATIEAIPTACAPLPDSLYDSRFLSTIACLPRAAQTTTAADGSFSLALDPGQYLIRARPADGTRFPWVNLSIPVANEPVVLGNIVVPLPVSVGMRLVDPKNDNPIVEALVSVYSLPDSGSAIQLGSALTDGDGRYEMFVALAQP